MNKLIDDVIGLLHFYRFANADTDYEKGFNAGLDIAKRKIIEKLMGEIKND